MFGADAPLALRDGTVTAIALHECKDEGDDKNSHRDSGEDEDRFQQFYGHAAYS